VFSYGLVKVEGKSMNNAKPININDGDYVLFSKQQHSEENDIVIASRRDENGEFAYMVKRHKKRDGLLVSESSGDDNSQPYEPIEINEDYQILGVVFAVVKPI
jgi:SOS-response transcriptional repressor LexA